MPAIKRFYSDLAGHPYYDSMEIEVQAESRGGVVKNLYVVKGISEKENSESVASLKFSTGHMNCVGLSVFLALAHEGAYTHNLGFLILDDPSQNLDGKHKEALAKVLAKMPEKSQLIVATEDESFQSQLASSFKTDDVVRVEFGAWDVDGPKIKVTK
jgi:DNA repair exonuclease SbcCD ATPase subunit